MQRYNCQSGKVCSKVDEKSLQFSSNILPVSKKLRKWTRNFTISFTAPRTLTFFIYIDNSSLSYVIHIHVTDLPSPTEKNKKGYPALDLLLIDLRRAILDDYCVESGDVYVNDWREARLECWLVLLTFLYFVWILLDDTVWWMELRTRNTEQYWKLF